MQKKYSYNSKSYFMQITLTGILAVIIFFVCVWLAATSKQMLFAFAALIAVYTVWNTFVSRSNPSEVLLEDDGISFISYGNIVKYKFDDIASFRAKDFRGSGKIFLRVNNSNLFRGRYWLHTQQFNDGDELFLYILKLEYKTHPTSIKARAWDSTRPKEDKMPVLPWMKSEEPEQSNLAKGEV